MARVVVHRLAGLRLPTWSDVLAREYAPWDRPRIVLDTAGRGVEDAVAELLARCIAPPAGAA